VTFRPAERPPPRDERVDRVEFAARDDVFDVVFLDDAPRPGRWLARLVVVRELRFLAVVAVLDRDAFGPEVLVVEPERERLDEPPLERRREWGTVEVIG